MYVLNRGLISPPDRFPGRPVARDAAAPPRIALSYRARCYDAARGNGTSPRL